MTTPGTDNDLDIPADREQPIAEQVERQRFFKFWRFALTRSFGIRIALAIGIVVASLFMNRSFLGWGLFAVLAVLVVPVGRSRGLVAAFVPYGLVWFVFTFLRSLADETVLAKTVNTKVASLERWIFNGELPTITLQADFYNPDSLKVWDYYFTFIHWSYFLVPHTVALYLWWKHPSRFRHYLTGMTLLLTLGLVLYFLVPTNPPWMAPESVNSPVASPALRIMEPIANSVGGGLYQASYKIVGESNPIAAMPSIHFAITFLLVWAAKDSGRGWSLAAWLYSLSMGAALVYLGEHYVVDVIAGGVVTSCGWIAARAWLSRGVPYVARLSKRSNRSTVGQTIEAT
ncbi:MAG: phosphatase PAP2 family protein [Thermomicrobiales bacterium]